MLDDSRRFIERQAERRRVGNLSEAAIQNVVPFVCNEWRPI